MGLMTINQKMKICKTEDEFVEYMWKVYPNDDQLDLRTAMLKTFNFLVGRYDQEEKERRKISAEIRQKMIDNGLAVLPCTRISLPTTRELREAREAYNQQAIAGHFDGDEPWKHFHAGIEWLLNRIVD